MLHQIQNFANYSGIVGKAADEQHAFRKLEYPSPKCFFASSCISGEISCSKRAMNIFMA